MVLASIACLLMSQAVLTYFWIWVASSYGDRSIPMLEWVPSYPPKSMRVLITGIVLMFAGLGLVSSELNPWKSGLLAGAVVALSAVPVYVHNLDLRHSGVETTMPAVDRVSG